MAEETTTPSGTPETKAKKEKPPAIENKPLQEFVEQDLFPALKKAFALKRIDDLELVFKKEAIAVSGISESEEFPQVMGSWSDRQFNVYFLQEELVKSKAFSCNTKGQKPSTLESFMIDERKVTLELLVSYVMQRLNGQKWLTRN